MADFETKLRWLSERGDPVGAEELIERIEADLAGDPLVVIARRREGTTMTKTQQPPTTKQPSQYRGPAWAVAVFVAVLAVAALFVALPGDSDEVADSPPPPTTVAPDVETMTDLEVWERQDARGWPSSFEGMTFSADSRWDGSNYDAWALWLDDNPQERFHVLANPRPVEPGCQPGPAITDADALARIIRSDPDLDVTEPVTVAIGGLEALRMDVVATGGGNLSCGMFLEGASVVTEETGSDGVVADAVVVGVGSRMRLYLLDLPGEPARILGIAIVAPEPRFDFVIEAATPILDSFKFSTD